MHVQNPPILTLFFLAFANCTSLSTLSPLILPRTHHLSPRVDIPVRPFQPPTCSPPPSESRTVSVTHSETFGTSLSDLFSLQCQRDSPVPFRCNTPDTTCALHTEPLHAFRSSRRRKHHYQTPVATTISRNMPLRCERNCHCLDNGEMTCGNDERYWGAERAKRFVDRLETACRPICSCQKRPWRHRKEEVGEEVTSGPRDLPLRGSESPPHRGAQGPAKGPVRSISQPGLEVPRRAGFQSPPPGGPRSPPHRGNQPPPRAGFRSSPPGSPRSPSPSSPPSPPPRGAHRLGFQSPPPEAGRVPADREPRGSRRVPSTEEARSSKRRKSQNPHRAGV